jgi:hypothetical protein
MIISNVLQQQKYFCTPPIIKRSFLHISIFIVFKLMAFSIYLFLMYCLCSIWFFSTEDMLTLKRPCDIHIHIHASQDSSFHTRKGQKAVRPLFMGQFLRNILFPYCYLKLLYIQQWKNKLSRAYVGLF